MDSKERQSVVWYVSSLRVVLKTLEGEYREMVFPRAPDGHGSAEVQLWGGDWRGGRALGMKPGEHGGETASVAGPGVSRRRGVAWGLASHRSRSRQSRRAKTHVKVQAAASPRTAPRCGAKWNTEVVSSRPGRGMAVSSRPRDHRCILDADESSNLSVMLRRASNAQSGWLGAGGAPACLGHAAGAMHLTQRPRERRECGSSIIDDESVSLATFAVSKVLALAAFLDVCVGAFTRSPTRPAPISQHNPARPRMDCYLVHPPRRLTLP